MGSPNLLLIWRQVAPLLRDSAHCHIEALELLRVSLRLLRSADVTGPVYREAAEFAPLTQPERQSAHMALQRFGLLMQCVAGDEDVPRLWASLELFADLAEHVLALLDATSAPRFPSVSSVHGESLENGLRAVLLTQRNLQLCRPELHARLLRVARQLHPNVAEVSGVSSHTLRGAS